MSPRVHHHFAPPRPSTSRPNLISWIGIMPGQALSKLTYKHQGHTKSGENTPLWRSSRAPPSGLHTPALRWLLTLNTASRLASSNIAFPSNLRHLTPRVESSSPVGTSTKDPSHPTQKPSQRFSCTYWNKELCKGISCGSPCQTKRCVKWPRLWNTVWKNLRGIPREFRGIPWNSKGVTWNSGVIQVVKRSGFSTISPGGILPCIKLRN